MKAHVSSILLGVADMDRSRRFYTEGLGWKVQNDYKISVFFVPHGGSLVGFYGRDGLAGMVGVSPDGSGFSGVVFNYRSEEHTSELQSLRHLVCRLLLEKKNSSDPRTYDH